MNVGLRAAQQKPPEGQGANGKFPGQRATCGTLTGRVAQSAAASDLRMENSAVSYVIMKNQ